jgi:hypothetical protein
LVTDKASFLPRSEDLKFINKAKVGASVYNVHSAMSSASSLEESILNNYVFVMDKDKRPLMVTEDNEKSQEVSELKKRHSKAKKNWNDKLESLQQALGSVYSETSMVKEDRDVVLKLVSLVNKNKKILSEIERD